MEVDGKTYHTIWSDEEKRIFIIDQRWLPHRFVVEEIDSCERMAKAIRDMHLRGAIVIGVAAAYGVYLAARDAKGDLDRFNQLLKALRDTRPTAVNLIWGIDMVLGRISGVRDWETVVEVAFSAAREVERGELLRCKMIGEHGVALIEELFEKKGDVVNILTHCNAGWLACVDYGTATAPIYEAHRRGIPVHIWVDETRPRNQGARLTAWEMLNQGIRHTVIADNTGGHLMQHSMVDMVIVGADRVTRRGDVANKIGTYLKALAAKDNGIPFYVALPGSTFDLSLYDGMAEIPIELRSPDEVRYAQGLLGDRIERVLLCPQKSPAVNYGFDVTPFNLISGFITEKGIIPAVEDSILALFGN